MKSSVIKFDNPVTRELTLAVIWMLLFIVALVLMYLFAIAPQERRLKQANSELSRLTLKVERYRDFASFAGKLAEQKARVTRVNGGSVVSVGDTSEQFYINEIDRVCRFGGVALDRVAPLATEKQAWSLSFKVKYRQLVEFLSILEQMFVVKSISVASGMDSSFHNVALVIKPIDFSVKGPEAHAGKDLFSLYDELESALASVDLKQAAAPPVLPIANDIMHYGSTVFIPEKVVAPRVRKVSPPSIKIDGIFWDPEAPLVSIGGKIVKEGDTLDGVLIKKIERTSIRVRWQSEDFTLHSAQ